MMAPVPSIPWPNLPTIYSSWLSSEPSEGGDHIFIL